MSEKESFFDLITHYVKGIFTNRRYPGIAVAIMFLLGPLFFVYQHYYADDSRLRKAREYFEEGNFPGAIEKVNEYLSDDPEAIDGLDLLADSHKAMAEISRGNWDKYIMHRCKAVGTYRKRLDLRFNNNVNNKLVIMENEGEMMSPRGNYVRCENGEPVGPETGFGGEGPTETW